MELIVAWQHPSSRRWSPVARLSRSGEEYSLRYVQGVTKPNVGGPALLPGMEDIHAEYRSRTLFPFFRNRLYNRKRADIDRYCQWLGLRRDDIEDPLVELSASGGTRATDDYQLLRIPEPTAGQYRASFFVHGVRYALHSPHGEAAGDNPGLSAGDRLYLQLDIQNPADPEAVSVRTDNPKRILGFVPRLMDRDLQRLIHENGPSQVLVTLAEVFSDAPLNIRYRCQIDAPWPKGFVPYADPEFQPLGAAEKVAFVA
jgi:hypothetical protein